MFDESIIINMVWGRMSQDEKDRLNNMSVDELKYYVNQISVEIQLQPTQTVGVDPNKEPDGTVDNMVTLTFDDNSTWEDTDSSSYLIERDNVIQFEQLFNLRMGDVVLLLDTTESLVDFVRKNVVENFVKKVVG